MGKIAEILESGRAPGFSGLTSPVDPQSVYALAPKGLREVESESLFKHGPARGAKRMSQYMGMPIDFIKRQWAKPAIKLILWAFLIAGGAFNSMAQPLNQISTPYQFVNGQNVSAGELNQLWPQATLTVQSIVGWPAEPRPQINDNILIASGGNLYKTTVSALMTNSIVWLNSPYNTPTNMDLLTFYSYSNQVVSKVFFSAFVNDVASILPVNGLTFAALSNGVPTNQVLTEYSPAQPNPYSTNGNVQYMLMWDTNGVPYSITISNFTGSLGNAVDTNYTTPWVYNEVFNPIGIYGTNSSGFQNPWSSNVFVITNLFMGTTNIPTLTNSDVIPILSTLQNSNTTVSLAALYGFFTNQNALPAYTQARIQFNGIPFQLSVSNSENTSYNLIQITNNFFPSSNVFAVSFITNTAVAPFNGAQTNTLYYVVPQGTNTGWLKVYSNYLNAVAGTNNIPVNITSGATLTKMVYLTNYTSFNCDVTAVITPPATLRDGIYDVWFRNDSLTPYYYMTGSVLDTANGGNNVSFAVDNIIKTNVFRINTSTINGTDLGNYPLVHVLVSPQ